MDDLIKELRQQLAESQAREAKLREAIDLAIRKIDDYRPVEALVTLEDALSLPVPEDETEKLRAELNAKQAEIDRLMLEYCPDEMTSEQIAEWGKHQVPYGETK